MPYQLGPEHIFPPVDRADRDGILAFGGDLDPDRVAAAYREGIFPWPSGRMLLWYAPAKRMVLRPGGANISRSMRKVLTSGRFELRINTESDASKFAFFEMQRILFERKFDLIDCQVHNEHLASLGAKEMSRNDFMRILTKGQEGEAPTVVD